MPWRRRGTGEEGRERPADGTGPRRERPARAGPSSGATPPRSELASRPTFLPAAERAAHRLYVQIAWSTLDGLPLVAPEAREAAEARLIALCRRLDAEPVAVRASASGVALLLRVTPSHAVGALATALKVGTEDALAAAGRPVRWARGFAASSVGPAEVRRRARRLRDAPGPGERARSRAPGTSDPSRFDPRAPTFPPSARG